MGILDALRRMKEKRNEKKEMFKEADQRLQIQKMLEERQKSANERELERFQKEEREEQIKESLNFYRKQRRDDIAFGHNPLNAKNITNYTQWDVLKEKNLFAGKSNLFSNGNTIMKDNNSLLKNSGWLMR